MKGSYFFMAKSQTFQKVYCGANWLKHGLTKYQVYLGGFPFNVQEAIKELPDIEKLFCDVEELDSFRAKIAKKGTRESVLYETTEKYIINSRKGNK